MIIIRDETLYIQHTCLQVLAVSCPGFKRKKGAGILIIIISRKNGLKVDSLVKSDIYMEGIDDKNA